MEYDLKGKIALVTGGARGIGYQTVKELLRNGVQGVTIVDINAQNGAETIRELAEEFGPGRAIFVETDVTKNELLEAAFKKTVDTWNCIDIVINSAAIGREEEWELEISVNCKSVVHATLLGLKYMAKDQGGQGGVIINLASTAGVRPFPLLPIYSATKHFVIGLGRSFGDSYHYNRTGVRILTMCPGITETSFLLDAIESPLSICADTGRDLTKIFENTNQSAEHVARNLVMLIEKAESGTVWAVRRGKPMYKLELPTEKLLETMEN